MSDTPDTTLTTTGQNGCAVNTSLRSMAAGGDATYTGNFDGVLGANAGARLAAETGIVAATTQTQVAATQLTGMLSLVSTVANSGDAVKLPALAKGGFHIVFNAGAHPVAVFPSASGDTIDGGSAAASVTLTNAKRAIFFCTAAGVIISAQLGVASA